VTCATRKTTKTKNCSLQRAAANLPPRRSSKARKETFVKVPLWWIEQATQATRTQQAFVCIWLLHLAWKTKSASFPVPNDQLAKRGIDRKEKHRALTRLEAAGLISIERRERKTPIVTLLFLQ
jgi:hypothetical protein